MHIKYLCIPYGSTAVSRYAPIKLPLFTSVMLLGDGLSVSSFTSVHASMTHSVSPDLNLPLTGIAMTLVFFYLRVKIPPGSMRSKLARIDWL